MPPRRRPVPLLAAAAPLALVALAVVAGVTAYATGMRDPEAADRALVSDLAEIGLARTTAPRLTFVPHHTPCPDGEPSDGTVPRAVCAGRDAGGGDAMREMEGRVAAAMRGAPRPGALHASALLDLMARDPTGVAADSAVSRLRAASVSADPARRSAARADLAAAYLVRAETRQDPRDLLEAVEAAEAALAEDSASLSARFNLALALDRLGFARQAEAAWRRYAGADPASPWGREAAARADVLAALRPPDALPAGEDSASLADFAARAPREARTFGWERVLRDWGTAVLAGDGDAAARRLDAAETLGHALVARGGDASLADAVDAIRLADGDGEATRRLARGHVDYAAGQALWAETRYEDAGERFARVLHPRPPSPPLAAWGAVFRAAALAYAQRPDEAVRLLEGVARGAPGERWPAVAGRAQWHLGTIAFRSGESDRATAPYRRAAAFLRAAGEDEYVGATEGLRGDAELTMGNTAAGWPALHGGIRRLRRFPRSQWLHVVLYGLVREATAENLISAALHAQQESMAAAASLPTHTFVVESRMTRARALAAAGDTAGAEEELTAVEPLLPRLDERNRLYLGGDLRLTRGLLNVARAPRRAVEDLDTAVARFARIHPLRVPPALAGRTRARLAMGDLKGATRDVEQMVRLLELRAPPDSSMLARRRTMVAGGRTVVDAVAMAHAAAGRHARALDLLSRGRAALLGERVADGGGMPPTRLGETAVRLALVGDTLLAWTAAPGAVPVLDAWPVDAAELQDDGARLRAALERRDDETALPLLSSLHARLLAPVSPRLPADGAVVLRVDEELAGVPFAALRGPGGRYVTQDHALRIAGPRGRRADGPPPADARALFVAEPVPGEGAGSGFRALDGARREALEAASAYPGARVLTGADATREAVAAAMQRAPLVHFAGHAALDDAHPERSYLLVSAATPGEGAGRLTAAALARMDLRHARLVVLSACGTRDAPEGAAAGFAGLTGAVLMAGAGGVVGSLWRVEDRRTEALMRELHRAYRQTGDGAAALRAAQLALLRSPDPALRAPSAWAGFQYVGR